MLTLEAEAPHTDSLELISYQEPYLKNLFGNTFAEFLKKHAIDQLRMEEGVHVRVIVLSAPSLPVKCIDFHVGQQTCGGAMSVNVVVCIAMHERLASAMVHFTRGPPTAQLLNDGTLFELGDNILKQGIDLSSSALTWAQIEELAQGKQVTLGARHPALPTIPPVLLEDGLTAAVVVLSPNPHADYDAPSQEELAHADGLHVIGPNTPTSGNRYEEGYEMTPEDRRLKKRYDGESTENYREIVLNPAEAAQETREEEANSTILIEMGEEEVTQRSDREITPPLDRTPPTLTPPLAATPRSPAPTLKTAKSPSRKRPSGGSTVEEPAAKSRRLEKQLEVYKKKVAALEKQRAQPATVDLSQPWQQQAVRVRDAMRQFVNEGSRPDIKGKVGTKEVDNTLLSIWRSKTASLRFRHKMLHGLACTAVAHLSDTNIAKPDNEEFISELVSMTCGVMTEYYSMAEAVEGFATKITDDRKELNLRPAESLSSSDVYEDEHIAFKIASASHLDRAKAWQAKIHSML